MHPPDEVDSLLCDSGVVSELVQVDFMWYSVLEEASVPVTELEESGGDLFPKDPAVNSM